MTTNDTNTKGTTMTITEDRVEIVRGDRKAHVWAVDGGWFYTAWIHNGRLLAENTSSPSSLQYAIDRVEDVIARSWKPA